MNRWTSLALALALAACVDGSTADVDSEDNATLTATSCRHVMLPLRREGATLLQADGKEFVPYGITVPGLAHADYADYTAQDDGMIDATAGAWCGNLVRLQVAQDLLVGADGTTFSQPFMAAIAEEVTRAESHGLMVSINAQTEVVGNEPLPTVATTAFWQRIAARYGNDDRIVFDLFNEPRGDTGDVSVDWDVWQHGGVYDGVRYLGMQAIADGARAAGAQNLLWIEGPYDSANLGPAATHLLSESFVMYEMHHPNGSHDEADWDDRFGYLATQHIAPVVVGEWTNYASTRSECWTDAPTAVPRFLQYLASLHIGMTAWTLRDGVLLESNAFDDPSHLHSDWKCADNVHESAGHQIMNFFIRQNGE